MKIYLAHNYVAKDWLRSTVKPALEADGHVITSRWVFEKNDKGDLYEALKNLEDVRSCDILLMFSDQYGITPGKDKYVELGYAVALTKHIIVIGHKERCVFYAVLQRVSDFDTARLMLKGWCV